MSLVDRLMVASGAAELDPVAEWLRPLRPRQVLVSTVDADFPGLDPDEPSAPDAPPVEVHVGEVAELIEVVDPDLIWLDGHVSWHQVRRDLLAVAARVTEQGRDWPVVVIIGPPPDPVLASAAPAVRRSLRHRHTSMRDGAARAAGSVVADHPELRLEVWAAGRGAVVIWPITLEALLAPAQPELRALGDAAARAEQEHDAITGERDRLADLVERFHDASVAVLASKRLQIGDQLVSATRRARRRSNSFRARDDLEGAIAEAAALGPMTPAVRSPEKLAPPTDIRVTYVLPEVRIAGGVLGVAQLASELTLLGADGRIVALRRRREVDGWRFLVEPTLYETAEELVAGTEATEVLVATHFSTVPWVVEMMRLGRARASVYFLQDYEPWFFAEDQPEERHAVRQTYDDIDHKIVKSDWLAALLAADHHDTCKIPLGFDLRFFYPRPVPAPDHPVIMAMARPRTPRRGYPSVLAALAQVHAARPDAEIILFGQDLSPEPVPFPYRPAGVVGDQDQLAALYSEATIHLDGSDFQAFGRPALEAMACGTPSVLTDVGGVSEYAVDGRNCLLVPPRQPEQTAAAILRLIEDQDLYARIRLGGYDTVLGYSMKQEAIRTLAHFHHIIASTP